MAVTVDRHYACPVWVKSGNAHNEPMMSAFHPKATEQRTQFYVGLVPTDDIAGEQCSDGEHVANATSMRRSAGDMSEVRNHSIDIGVGKVGGIETSHLHSRPVAHRCGIAH